LTELKKDAVFEKEFGNAEGVFRNLVELRQQKILWKALKDLKASAVSSEGLAEEEKAFYLDLLKLLTGFEGTVLSGRAGEATASVVVESGKAVKKESRTRFLVDLPAFEWVDSKSYGPFKKGDVVDLGNELESFLLEKKAVEVV
jgi:DNA replication initiation complex subunit (GINS family)